MSQNNGNINNASASSNNIENSKIDGSGGGCGGGAEQQTNNSRIRNIPIFLEDRNETILNVDAVDSVPTATGTVHSSTQNHQSESKPIFTRVKDIPVKKFVPTAFDNNRRSASPSARCKSSSETVHIPVQHQQSSKLHQQQQQYQQHQQHQYQQYKMHQQNQKEDQNLTPKKVQSELINDPIVKIETIQKEVLGLMEQIENFKGGNTKKCKDYMYLDEMLTQNLLKLDTIDTNGKENIKAARKEAINCINKCISVLESKLSAGREATNNT